MSKKHFEKAALIAQDVGRFGTDGERKAVVEAFVALFRGENGRFDVERFRRACVPGANVRARS